MSNLQQIKSKIMFIVVWGLSSLLPNLYAASDTHSRGLDIVVTIKPLYNLMAPLVVGAKNSKLTLLLTGNSSPCGGHQLRPGELKSLQQADLIVLTSSRGIEVFLAKLLKQPEFSKKSLAIEDISKINKLPSRKHKHNCKHSRNHNVDGHFWLSPANAKVIIRALQHKLSAMDPENSHIYTANSKEFIDKLEQLDQTISKKTSTLNNKSYVVFHDAYQYFEQHYKLSKPIVISDNPSIPLSANRLLAISQSMQSSQAKCMFKEPQFDAKILDSLLDAEDLNGGLKIGILDPLGSDQDLGVDGYLKLINNLADQFYGCLND
jgi:zinc transport system substrate-binding protein